MDTIKKKFGTLTRGKKKKSKNEKTQEEKEDIHSKPILTTQRSTFYEENIPKSIDKKVSTLDIVDPEISDVLENPTKTSDFPEKPLHNGVKPNDIPENTTENPDLLEDINHKPVSEDSSLNFNDPKITNVPEKSPQNFDENSALKSAVNNFCKKSEEKRGSVVFSVIVESSSDSESEDIDNESIVKRFKTFNQRNRESKTFPHRKISCGSRKNSVYSNQL